MKIRNIADRRFRKFGTVIKGIDVSSLVDWAKTVPVTDQVEYVPSVPEAEALEASRKIRRLVYGGMPVEVGYCAGRNRKADTLEYHRSEEVNIAASDLIVVVGSRADMDSAGSFDLARAEAYFVPEGTVYLFYSSTLHYAPCSVKADGFCSVVILPEGTNTELPERRTDRFATEEDCMLSMKNKWVLTHPLSGEAYYPGLKGDIIEIGEEAKYDF